MDQTQSPPPPLPPLPPPSQAQLILTPSALGPHVPAWAHVYCNSNVLNDLLLVFSYPPLVFRIVVPQNRLPRWSFPPFLLQFINSLPASKPILWLAAERTKQPSNSHFSSAGFLFFLFFLSLCYSCRLLQVPRNGDQAPISGQAISFIDRRVDWAQGVHWQAGPCGRVGYHRSVCECLFLKFAGKRERKRAREGERERERESVCVCVCVCVCEKKCF